MSYLTEKEKNMIRKWSGEETLQNILNTTRRKRENSFLEKIKG